MAKVRLDPRVNIDERALTVTGKRPSLGGVISIRPSVSGRPYAAIFPPKRQRTTQRQMLASLWFKYMAYVYKVSHALLVENYKSQALGLWLQPRDIFFAAMSGRLFWFEDENGKKWFSSVAWRDMTQSLDILAQEPGSILFRNTEYWDGLPPGTPGDILRIDQNGLPVWSPSFSAIASESRTVGLFSQWIHTGQGAGSTGISFDRRAIRVIGVATSKVTWSVFSPTDAHNLSVSLYFERTGSDGGDYHHKLRTYVVKNDGTLSLHDESVRIDPAPAPGGSAKYTFPAVPFLYDPLRTAVMFVYNRLGADTADTNNSDSYLWLYEVSRF